MGANRSRFLGSIIFRGLSIAVFVILVAAFFIINPSGGASQGPLRVRVAVPAEAFSWVKEAADEFNRSSTRVSGQPVTVEVSSFNTAKKALDDTRQSLNGSDPFSAVIVKTPLKSADAGLFTSSGDYAPAVIARTYIIGVIRGEYADALSRQLGKSDLSVADFQALFDPNSPADSPVSQVKSGRPRWGVAGSADDPDAASAVYALTMALQGSGTPQITDPALQPVLQTLYAAAPQSRATFDLVGQDMANFGPTGPSAAMLSEVVALRTAGALAGKGQKLQLLYPQQALEQAFQYGIVGSGNVSGKQRDGALKFRQFLLGKDWQLKATSSGLRQAASPADIGSGDNPWQRLASSGAQPGYQPAQVAQPMEAEWTQTEQLANRLANR